VTKKLYKQSCEKVDSHRSDGRSVKKVNPLDIMDGTADDPNAPPTGYSKPAELGIGDLVQTAKDNEARAGPYTIPLLSSTLTFFRDELVGGLSDKTSQKGYS
jgi:hypothetical protein